MEKERQIVRNSTGVIFSVANVIVMLASLAAAIYFMYLYNSGETSFPNNEVDLVMRYLGFTIAPLFFLRSDEDRVYVYLATGCFLVACLPHLYIHFRALLQPSFLAGNPDKMVKNMIYTLSTNSFL